MRDDRNTHETIHVDRSFILSPAFPLKASNMILYRAKYPQTAAQNRWNTKRNVESGAAGQSPSSCQD
jgi:hypothetical protein